MSDGDSAAYHLAGHNLDGWLVLSPVALSTGHSGSAYSVGYIAQHETSATMGFVKAFDYSDALNSPDPARVLAELTAAYNAERDLLNLCGDRRLRRIVRALAAGTVRVTGFVPNAVSYLIFELAEGDARNLRTITDPAEHLPILKLAHHTAVAMSQLHSVGAAHQDVKPSNVLYWGPPSEPDGKLADLGCAYVVGRPAPHDDRLVAGDCSYSSPEQLYSAEKGGRSPRPPAGYHLPFSSSA